MRSRGFLRPFLPVALLLSVAVSARADVMRTDISDFRTANLPWSLVQRTNDPNAVALDRGWVTPLRVVDADGNGLPDIFHARRPGVVRIERSSAGSVNHWQHNVPVAYDHRAPCASVDGVWDVTGGGRPECVISSAAADRSRWLIQGLDIETGEVRHSVEVAGGEDHRPDGRWDGNFKVVLAGPVPTDRGPRPAFVVLAEAGFDLQPRGLRAVDAESGAVLWECLIGPKPTVGTVFTDDVDADGRPEIIFCGNAVNNLHGARFNGTSDDTARVFVFNDDGSLLWQRPFTGRSTTSLTSAAWRGRQVVYLATCYNSDNAANSVQALDGATGRVLERLPTDFPAFSLLARSAADGGVDLFLGSRLGSLVRMRHDERLEIVRQAETGAQTTVHGVGDLLPEDGPELLAVSRRVILVTDLDLRPLATYGAPDSGLNCADLFVAPGPGGDPELAVIGHDDSYGAWFEPVRNRRAVPWGAIALVPAAGGAVFLARRRRRRPSAGTRRELRLQLLGRLELSGHGAIGALKSLRRLVWILEARAGGFTDSADHDARLLAIANDCREHMLPHVEGTLELARLAGLPDAEVDRAAAAATRVGHLLRETVAGGRDAAAGSREAELCRQATTLDQSLRRLRDATEAGFRADLAAVTARVLAAHAPPDDGAAATVTAGLDVPLWCGIDENELLFVVENLVANAWRAMTGSAVRRLALTAEKRDGMVMLSVQDTGCGIAPDDWEVVLETRRSSRTGGGLGLPESRRRLRKYGGSLTITASEPGAGTTVVMAVPAYSPARIA